MPRFSTSTSSNSNIKKGTSGPGKILVPSADKQNGEGTDTWLDIVEEAHTIILKQSETIAPMLHPR